MKPPRGSGRNGCLIHRDIAPLLDVGDRDTVIQQGAFEGEGTANEEADEIVAPELGDVRMLAYQLTVAVNAVFRDVGADIPTGKQLRVQLPWFQHPENGAGLGVALGEKQEVEGVLLRQNHEVG